MQFFSCFLFDVLLSVFNVLGFNGLEGFEGRGFWERSIARKHRRSSHCSIEYAGLYVMQVITMALDSNLTIACTWSRTPCCMHISGTPRVLSLGSASRQRRSWSNDRVADQHEEA
jgi:hypothetical protein